MGNRPERGLGYFFGAESEVYGIDREHRGFFSGLFGSRLDYRSGYGNDWPGSRNNWPRSRNDRGKEQIRSEGDGRASREKSRENALPVDSGSRNGLGFDDFGGEFLPELCPEILVKPGIGLLREHFREDFGEFRFFFGEFRIEGVELGEQFGDLGFHGKIIGKYR